MIIFKNADTTLTFTDLPSIRLIQEDEYDQHMRGRRPKTSILSNGHYVIFLK